MSNNEKQIEANSLFLKRINNQYIQHCRREQTDPTIKGFSKYILNLDVIIERTINRYLVLAEYEKELYDADGRKNQAVNNLEERFCVKERTIKSIISNRSRYFIYRDKTVS